MIPLRLAREYTYQLHHAGEQERLAKALANIPVFMVLYQGETHYDVLRYWAKLGEDYDREEAYQRGLQQWGGAATSEGCGVLGQIAEMFEAVGRMDAARGLQQERLALALEQGDRAQQAASHRGIGGLLWIGGEYAESLRESTRARELFDELGDRRGVSLAIGDMGLVYYDRGEYDRALECYREKEMICHEIGDRRGMSYAIGNMGLVFAKRGEYDRAMECYQQNQRVCREIGDRRGLMIASGSMGQLYSDRQEYDCAMECFREQELVCRELGDRRGLWIAISNIGITSAQCGEFDHALECFREQELICRELGERRGLSLVIGNMGNVYYDRGEYDRALVRYREKESICREIGDDRGLWTAIGNMGGVYNDCGESDRALDHYHRALSGHREISSLDAAADCLAGCAGVFLSLIAQPCTMPVYLQRYLPDATEETWRGLVLEQARRDATESLAINEQFPNPDTFFSGRVLLTRVDAAEGHREEALQNLTNMLWTATDDGQRAELHYWLWKLDVGTNGQTNDTTTDHDHHHREALALYEKLIENTPKHEYRKRIEELTATPNMELRDGTE